MRHIDAIEAILYGRSSSSSGGAAGASGASAPKSLDRAQIEQIKTQLAELRKALSQAER
jgi:hypothetical protein